MASIMRGTEIPFDLKNLPDGTEIKRLDFSQNGQIKITKTGEDFTIVDDAAYATLTQEDTLKLDDKHMIEIQLSVYINDTPKRTLIKSVSPDKILYEGVI